MSLGTFRTDDRGILRAVLCAALLAPAILSESAWAQWPQWGGPDRNFIVKTSGLADQWPEEGPRRLWYRELGDGYSGIACDDGVLYTMYRRARTDKEEYTVALDARTGKTLWEHKNAAPYVEPPDERWGGHGPNTTPLVVGDRLFTIGSRSVLHCFNKKTGEVLWKHDLVGEFGTVPARHFGHSPSPIAYGGLIIVTDGREPPESGGEFKHDVPELEAPRSMQGQSVMAFDQASGKLAWKSLDVLMGYSSPILIRLAGENQLVFSTHGGLLGVNPENGGLLWQHPKRGNPVSPVWNGEDTLFYCSAGDSAHACGVGVRLTKVDDKTIPQELYFSRKIKFQQPTPVRLGDYLYGSDEQSFLGVEMSTGKRAWLKRGFPMASCIHADGKLIILDQDGNLTLATATPEGLTVHSRYRVTERYSFTVPTLVGTTLYVRDCKHIMALDLS